MANQQETTIADEYFRENISSWTNFVIGFKLYAC